MTNDDRTYGKTDTDKDRVEDQGEDTEGHDARRQFPAPPVVSGEDNWPQGLISDSGDGRAQHDTEGHRVPSGDPALPQRPGPGEALPRRPGPGEHLDGEHDTEGHLQFRRRPGEAGE